MRIPITTIPLDIDAHIHMNWFEVSKFEGGVIIMCQDGCRRMLNKNGEVCQYNRQKEEWVKII